MTSIQLKVFFSVDMQDFSQLPSKMVTEVLMLEMKMAPAAKAYLVSGFPRSMRDVVEYSDKVFIMLFLYFYFFSLLCFSVWFRFPVFLKYHFY